MELRRLLWLSRKAVRQTGPARPAQMMAKPCRSRVAARRPLPHLLPVVLLLSAAALCAASTTASAAPLYTFTDLRTLGGTYRYASAIPAVQLPLCVCHHRHYR